jgi:hypothetical protein
VSLEKKLSGVSSHRNHSFSTASYRHITIDGHVCWNSNCWLLLIVCQPRKQTSVFCSICSKQLKFVISVFCVRQTSGSYCFLLVLFSLYIYLLKQHHFCIRIYTHIYMYVYIYAAISNRKRKPRQFSLIRLPLLIGQTEVCRMSLCWPKNKWKLSVCKQTKRTCPSLHIIYTKYDACV